MIVITPEPIDPAKAYGLITADAAGSILLHYAVVKPAVVAGAAVKYIDYTARGDAEGELEDIADSLDSTYFLKDILLIRRTGRLGPGEIISLVAASSSSSEDAFETCRQGISRLKQMKTIVKQDIFA